MLWARKTVGRTEYHAVIALAEQLHRAGVLPSVVLLVTPVLGVLILGTTEFAVLSAFPGFDRLDEEDLPALARLLVGPKEAFAKYFYSSANA